MTGFQKKIFLDTDIGTNIDDSLALQYLLQNPMADLIGIGIVTGNSMLRAQIAASQVRNIKKQLIIYTGHEMSLEGKLMQSEVPLFPAMHNPDLKFINSTVKPWDYLAENIKKEDGKIHIIAIGPLTNIAQFILYYPDLSAKLGSITFMGGFFHSDNSSLESRPERNANNDPKAFKIVIEKAMCPVYCLGKELTRKTEMDFDEFEDLLRKSRLEILLRELELFKQKRSHLILHDVLAVMCPFIPVVKFETSKISIDTESGLTDFLLSSHQNDPKLGISINLPLFRKELKQIIF